MQAANGRLPHWAADIVRAELARQNRPDPFAAELRRLREGRGTTTGELSQAIGFDRSAVSRWEGGGRRPRLMHLARIGEALRLSDADLGRLVRLAGEG